MIFLIQNNALKPYYEKLSQIIIFPLQNFMVFLLQCFVFGPYQCISTVRSRLPSFCHSKVHFSIAFLSSPFPSHLNNASQKLISLQCSSSKAMTPAQVPLHASQCLLIISIQFWNQLVHLQHFLCAKKSGNHQL